MGLFDDDFYSTRVSRKAKSGRSEWSSGSGTGRFNPSTLQIAFVSSAISALGAVLLFSLIFGFDLRGGPAGGQSGAASQVQPIDTAERIIQASAKVRPAVVSIINEQLLPEGGFWGGSGRLPGDGDAGEDVLPEDEGTLQQASLGSGVIFQREGGKARIITNYHVVDGAYAVKAMLVNGEIREAQVVGKDQITDLAVLEIDARGIDTIVDIGDSSKLRDGETVIAIGNPLGLGDSLTMGIVSKSHRIIPVSLNQDGVYDWEQEVIQIDASINQGNSGGALVNLNGEVVGINSMKVADYGVEGLGFAIPMHNAMPIVESLLQHGKVPRPYLGVYTMDLEQYMLQQRYAREREAREEESDGAGERGGDAGADEGAGESGDGLKLPEDVKRGAIVLEAVGPAQEAGLTYNDVIVKLDNQPIGSTMELRKYLYSRKKIGDKIVVGFYRDGKLESISFKLGEREDED